MRIDDVAREAGVSITTVSHALSGKGRLPDETRERVRRVAADLGYAPNPVARSLAGEYQDILGKGRFFLELQDHKIPEQRKLNEQLLRLAPETGLPLIVTNDLHYVHPEQHDSHDVLLCVGSSLEVHPIAQLPGTTLEHGGAVAIVTQGSTPWDDRAAVKLDGDVVAELQALVAAL